MAPCWAHLPGHPVETNQPVDQMLNFMFSDLVTFGDESELPWINSTLFPVMIVPGHLALAVTLFCKNSVESSSSRLSEFHNSSLSITKSSLNVCVYKYMYVYVCVSLLLLKLFQLDSHSNVIFICNKVIKLFLGLNFSMCVEERNHPSILLHGSGSWCFENRISNTKVPI